MNNYPTVRTDDILIHPRDGDLIAASHGRSIWIADDITPLEQWNAHVAASDATLFDVRPAVAYVSDIRLDVSTGGEKQFEGENPARGTAIQFYLKSAGDARVSISDASGRVICESSVKAAAGINRVQWTLVAPRAGPSGAVGSCTGATGGRGGGPPAAGPGSYLAKLTVGGRDYTKPVTVLEDRWMTER